MEVTTESLGVNSWYSIPCYPWFPVPPLLPPPHSSVPCSIPQSIPCVHSLIPIHVLQLWISVLGVGEWTWGYHGNGNRVHTLRGSRLRVHSPSPYPSGILFCVLFLNPYSYNTTKQYSYMYRSYGYHWGDGQYSVGIRDNALDTLPGNTLLLLVTISPE